MSFYSDTEEGRVKATMILAVPRSASTMLSRALSASPDVDVNVFQPFYIKDNGKTNDLDLKLAEVMEHVNATPENPVRVLMKVMAESVSGQHFRHLMIHTENTVVLLRDPQSQAMSAYRAYWRMPSGKQLSDEERAMLKTMRSTKDLEHYVVTPWEHMAKHVEQLARQPDVNWAVVDGDVLRLQAAPAMRRICEHCGISFKPNMLNGWDESTDKTIGVIGHHYRPSWLGRAMRTNGIKPPTSMTPRLEDFSVPVREQIIKNLKTYVKLIASNRELAPKVSDLETLVRHGAAESNPIALYTLAATLPQEQVHQQRKLLAAIREQAPQYASSYTIIDRVAGVASPRVAVMTASARGC